MKRQTLIIGLILLGVAIGLACGVTTDAQRQAPTAVNSAYTMSGPYSHNNLTIFLIHGADQMQGRVPLTLQEAMAQKKVKVHETSEVNELAIENVSAEEVYVQSGDIVKGGKQDRVLAYDLIVPPHSGRMPLEAFCVEHGRWSGRGSETAAAFSGSSKMLNSKDLKLAAKHKNSQSEVWDKVAQAQTKLGAGVAAASPMIAADSSTRVGAGRVGNVAGGGGGEAAETVTVTSSASASSLQLTLENTRVQQTAGEYIKKLSPVTAGKTDVIGFVFAINGQLNSADVYSSNALFKKLWSKLLEASAIEAISEFQKDKTFAPLKAESAMAFLKEAESGKSDEKKVTARVTMIKRETDKNLFFETRDHRRNDTWMHRNYLTK